MLHRQKILLYMLDRAGETISRLELTKLCFLLRQETPLKGEGAFYDFVPYRYGPFSFALYREADKLEKSGILGCPSDKHWSLNQDVSQYTDSLSDPIRNDIDELLKRFQYFTQEKLIDYVYNQYPWFTVNSERKKMSKRQKAALGVYTAGYEGQSIDSFLNNLVQNGLYSIIDVRRNPVARRYGFHKSTLCRLCSYLDIEYVHMPELGIGSKYRKGLSTASDYEKLFMSYKKETLAKETLAINKIACFMMERPSALVCMEADPLFCHRTLVAEAVRGKTGLPVEHL